MGEPATKSLLVSFYVTINWEQWREPQGTFFDPLFPSLRVCMYWVFADSQHLTEVIATQTLPEEIVHSEVIFGELPDDKVWIKPTVSIPRNVARKLKTLGVQPKRRMRVSGSVARSSWWQILPPTCLPGNSPIDRKESVILQLPQGDELTRTLREILRLGGTVAGRAFLPRA